MGNCCSSESTATIPHAAAAAEPKATQPLVTATGTATPESGPDGNIDPTAKPDLPVPAEDDFTDANGNTIPPVFARVIDSPRSAKKVVQGEHVDLDGPGETQTVQIGNYNLRFSYYSKRGYYPEGDGIYTKHCPRKETEPAKSEGEVKWIKEIVKGNFLFSHLSEEKVLLKKISVKAGDIVIRQGTPGDTFYLVDTGDFEVRLRSDV
ncbi:hypothetical protein P43SY_011371 [Pythium insidiosum]|uniref:Cyclic nucleotide-binding domain-containing protein n=1 Tax=Pythium insidiosum TaxID=114742 RepID=A0AAD5M871_PYTIN|nr:hypothetical protein P43SY_011371 [Pythium insidiosum]